MQIIKCAECLRNSYTADGSRPVACPWCAEDRLREDKIITATAQAAERTAEEWLKDARALHVVTSEVGATFFRRAMLAAARAGAAAVLREGK